MASAQGRRFKDKVAIVTGGCNGIGRGIVDVFGTADFSHRLPDMFASVENGGKVVVLDIDEKAGMALTTSGPGEMVFIRCDVRKEEELKKAVDLTVRKYGQLDCLVNNAGTHPGFAPVDAISTSDFKNILDLNVVPFFVATREALPHLRKTKGSIINMSSMSGVNGQIFSSSYCTTKAAVAGLTMGVACDEGRNGVRVNAIAPGPIDTPLLKILIEKSGDPDMNNKVQQYSHFNQKGTPREVGLLCLFLAVDATFMTGEVIPCSGGSAIGFGVK